MESRSWFGQSRKNLPLAVRAEKSYELSFNLLDRRNNSRVRYERINEATGEPVPWDQIVKAYEYEKDNYVILGEEDFKRAAVEATQSIEIDGFVEDGQISPLCWISRTTSFPANRARKAMCCCAKP